MAVKETDEMKELLNVLKMYENKKHKAQFKEQFAKMVTDAMMKIKNPNEINLLSLNLTPEQVEEILKDMKTVLNEMLKKEKLSSRYENFKSIYNKFVENTLNTYIEKKEFGKAFMFVSDFGTPKQLEKVTDEFVKYRNSLLKQHPQFGLLDEHYKDGVEALKTIIDTGKFIPKSGNPYVPSEQFLDNVYILLGKKSAYAIYDKLLQDHDTLMPYMARALQEEAFFAYKHKDFEEYLDTMSKIAEYATSPTSMSDTVDLMLARGLPLLTSQEMLDNNFSQEMMDRYVEIMAKIYFSKAPVGRTIVEEWVNRLKDEVVKGEGDPNILINFYLRISDDPVDAMESLGNSLFPPTKPEQKKNVNDALELICNRMQTELHKPEDADRLRKEWEIS